MPPYSGFQIKHNPRLNSNTGFNLRDWNDIHAFDQNTSGGFGNSMEGFQAKDLPISESTSNGINFGSLAKSATGPIAGTIKKAYNAYAPDLYTMNTNDQYEQLAYNSIYGRTNDDPLSRAAAIFQSNSARMAPAINAVESLEDDFSEAKNNDNLYNAYYDNPLFNLSTLSTEEFGKDNWKFAAPLATAVTGLAGVTPLTTTALALTPLTATSKRGQDFNQSTFQGAMAGTQYGGLGWGTLIGAGLGSLANVATNIGAGARTEMYNRALTNAQQRTLDSFYDTAANNLQRNIRNSRMNNYIMAEGGSLDGLNGVTEFNVGGTHEQNPNEGIQQGIASDNLPNLVEQGELKYKDYIYSNRLKPSKSLLDKYNLPDKYAGESFAEIGDKLQKESEDRPNDPISLRTLDEWMTRLRDAQEEYKAKQAERKLAKMVDNMSTEEKAMLMSSLAQPMMQEQEGIDLGQPMYKSGGKIYIKPENRGKFTALKKRTGKSASWFKAHGTPAQKKMATFALNAKKWSHKHPDGDYLDLLGNRPMILGSEYDYTINPYLYNIEQEAALDAYLNLRPNTTEPIVATPIKDNIATPKMAKNNTTNNTEIPNIDFSKLRYAPAVGAVLGALEARLQPKDYTYADALANISSMYHPIAAPHIGGYRKYTPYDVNLGDAENLALEAQALASTRGMNRATQAAANIATINAFQKAKAQRNLAAQQANEANRLGVDQYNLGINQFNAQRDAQYDQLNQHILNNRLRMLSQAAAARDASDTAWAQNVSSTTENAWNQIGNVGRDEWNRGQFLAWLREHPATAKAMGIEI